jgi:thiamine biosynthesis lipoprotein
MQSTPDLARRFATLAAMGFERVEEVPVTRGIEPAGRRAFRVVHSRPAMGTEVRISTRVRSPDRADHATGEAFAEMDRLVGIFSHYDGSSAATLLNERGWLAGPPPELVDVVEHALHYHRLTRGGFDISVAPVVELFRQRRGTALPAGAEIRAALELVGSDHIEISNRRLGFDRQGMRLTFDGIAKGYIVDAAARVLERHRIRNYLVEAGGDIRARGSRGDGRPWTIAVQNPDKTDHFLDTLALSSGAVATSGSYEEFYDPDRQHHHIISADTGTSPQGASSVTVIAPTAQAADALATSVFLMSPSAGLRFLDSLAGCEGLIVRQDGSLAKSTGWRSVVQT